MELNNVKSFSDWDSWKQTMAKAINLGETVGFSEETIKKIGFRIGNFLSANVDPENREHRLLHELWKVGDDSERMVLTKMLVKMVQAEDMKPH
ncbi:MAG: DUF3243 domain-containing protein [Clostridiales bacterium]|jgi:hypothetical protein|nr:DUF3243 domain-containing protein [Eubacteriales bacterium]MDH7564865.1 DUF3243 domain-containing protein [Clostridiales bacterium]